MVSTAGCLSGVLVLVVEDNAVNQIYFDAVLSQAGATVEIAVDGFAAVDRVARLPKVQAVLLDLRMPGIDGFETARRIRRTHPTLTVIGQSADNDPKLSALCQEAGMDARLDKPVDTGQLIALIQSLVARNAAAEGT